MEKIEEAYVGNKSLKKKNNACQMRMTYFWYTRKSEDDSFKERLDAQLLH